MDLDPTTTKYLIKADMNADGVVEKPDVIGAIFGQTEGLLGDELDLRDLQKSGRIGRIEVTADSKKGKTSGEITLPSSLDKVETAILAAALESIDRVGPCKAEITVTAIDDVRVSKRSAVAERAKQLLQDLAGDSKGESGDLIDDVKQAVRIEELVSYGSERLPAGPNVSSSDAILVVEGRNDVANLLRNGIKNAVATEGTSIPKTISDLAHEKVVTAFVDGDRGGELLLKELLQVAEVDFVARAPPACEVEELTQKQIMKALRNKLPADQFIKELGVEAAGKAGDGGKAEASSQQQDQRSKPKQKQRERPKPRRDRQKTEGGQDDDRGRGKSKGRSKSRSRSSSKSTSKGGGRDRGRDRGKDRDRDRDRDRGRSRGRDEQQEDRSEPSRPTGPLGAYKTHLDELSGKLQGVMLDDKETVVKGPIPVRELADTLKKDGDGIKAVVFDGVITQRLLDIAVEKGIQTLVGVKLGNVTKQPNEVEVFTRSDL